MKCHRSLKWLLRYFILVTVIPSLLQACSQRSSVSPSGCGRTPRPHRDSPQEMRWKGWTTQTTSRWPPPPECQRYSETQRRCRLPVNYKIILNRGSSLLLFVFLEKEKVEITTEQVELIKAIVDAYEKHQIPPDVAKKLVNYTKFHLKSSTNIIWWLVLSLLLV